MAIMVTFECEYCGCEYKALISEDDIKFSVQDKLIANDDLLDDKGILTCIDCEWENNIRFIKFLVGIIK